MFQGTRRLYRQCEPKIDHVRHRIEKYAIRYDFPHVLIFLLFQNNLYGPCPVFDLSARRPNLV